MKLAHVGMQVGQDAGVVLQHVLEDLGLEDSLGFFLGGWLGSLPQVLPGLNSASAAVLLILEDGLED